jgi:hypothetical protein
MYSKIFFSKIVPFMRLYGKNIVEPDRRMRISYWIPKAVSRHSEYVILIAFPLQQ